jgi:glycosyltransferase involved in cell wall biosynthesis
MEETTGNSSRSSHNTHTDVSIIIPAKNEENNIAQCLNAILNQKTQPPLSIEIIIIDSGSTDKTLRIIQTFPSIKLIRIKPEDFGHGKTRNLGAQIAKGKYITFLNADAIPIHDHWLQTLIEPFRENPKLAGTFSRHIPNPDCFLYMTHDLLTSMPEQTTSKKQGLLFSTVSAAMPKEMWIQFPFDDNIIIAEDRNWAEKVLAKGWEILYQPASIVRHSHNYSSRELMESKRRIARASKRFEHPFTARTVGFVLTVGGFFLKFLGDILFIFFKTPGIPFRNKIKELKISLLARAYGFRGWYKGWNEHE